MQLCFSSVLLPHQRAACATGQMYFLFRLLHGRMTLLYNPAVLCDCYDKSSYRDFLNKTKRVFNNVYVSTNKLSAVYCEAPETLSGFLAKLHEPRGESVLTRSSGKKFLDNPEILLNPNRYF